VFNGLTDHSNIFTCQMIRVSAIGESKATDATGAGDLFASGFLYGVVKGLPLEECCKVGTCSGGSVIRSLGGEVTSENWQWMYKQMQVQGLPTPNGL
jgi:sugar/nucleoside kinase (ribokinase family)